jgi:hypothetical protein
VQNIGYLEQDLLRNSISNIPGVNMLPAKGLNVYDILKHRTLVFTADGLADTIARIRRPVLRGFKPLGFDWKAHEAGRPAARLAQRAKRKEIEQWLQERGVAVGAKRICKADQLGEGTCVVEVAAVQPVA